MELGGAKFFGPSLGMAKADVVETCSTLFAQGMTVEQVAQQLERARATTFDYLEAYIEHVKLTDATRWCDPYEIWRIETVSEYVDDQRLKPIHVALHGTVSYDTIRIVLACKRNRRKL